MNIKGKNRYTLINENGVVIGSSSSIEGIAKLVNCTKQWIYMQKLKNKFVYKKETYTIIDKLD